MDRAQLISAMQATANAAPIPVPTKAWGTVYVRPMTVDEVDNLEEESASADSKDKSRIARGACRVICDESGQRIFDASSEEDIALLAKQPWSLLRKVLAAADGGDPGNV